MPGPATADFQLHGDAQECSNEDDNAQDRDAFQGGGDGYGADDVCGNQKFQTEEQRAAEVFAVKLKIMLVLWILDFGFDKPNSSQHNAQDNDSHAQNINDFRDNFKNDVDFHD